MTKLPKFEMVINPDENSDVQVSQIAFVDKPAIEKNFMAFKDLKLDFTSIPDKHIVSGPAMVPDMLIYRRDEMGEYNVFFSKDTISQIALKFFKKDFHKNLNLFHDPALTLDNVTIFESFQSDKSRGILPMKGYEDLPDGTWFISAKIEDPKIWEMVLNGSVKGFSVEGIFSYVKKQVQSADEILAEILNRPEFANGHINKTELMSTAKEMLAQFKQKFLGNPLPPVVPAVPAAPAKMDAMPFKLKDGTDVKITIEDPTVSTAPDVGDTMTQNDVPAAPGDYELSDGTKITVGDGGLITACTPGAAAPPAFEKQFGEINTKLTAYEARFAQYEQTFTEVKATLQKTNETILGLVGIVEKLAAEPTAQPANPPHSFKANKEETSEERIQRLAQSFKKLKSA